MGIFDEMVEAIHEVPSFARSTAKWRMSKKAYMEVVDLAAGPEAKEDPADWPAIYEAHKRVNQQRRERLEALQQAWGKNGTTLFGHPVICDPDMVEGFTLEVEPWRVAAENAVVVP